MEEIIIKERQLREDISKLINEAKLPAIIIKPILKDYYEQITMLEQQQYQQVIEKNEKKGDEKLND